jgi:hypothetical protein
MICIKIIENKKIKRKVLKQMMICISYMSKDILYKLIVC